MNLTPEQAQKLMTKYQSELGDLLEEAAALAAFLPKCSNSSQLNFYTGAIADIEVKRTRIFHKIQKIAA